MANRAKKPEEVKVSLLPGEKDRQAHESSRRLAVRFLAFIIVAGIALGAFVFYFKISESRVSSENVALNSEIERVSAVIETQSQRIAELRELAGETSFTKTMLRDHKAVENLLNFLEQTTIPEVMLTHLAADNHGSLVLRASAKNNDAAVRQVLAWSSSESVQDVQVSGFTTKTDLIGNVEGVEFSAMLMLEKAVLNWNP